MGCSQYDESVPAEAYSEIEKLFSKESLIVPKKGKNGVQDQDIIPMIQHLEITKAGERELVLSAVVCCQNPSLNPMQLVSAISLYLPGIKPDFAKCRRIEIYDGNQSVFR